MAHMHNLESIIHSPFRHSLLQTHGRRLDAMFRKITDMKSSGIGCAAMQGDP